MRCASFCACVTDAVAVARHTFGFFEVVRKRLLELRGLYEKRLFVNNTLPKTWPFPFSTSISSSSIKRRTSIVSLPLAMRRKLSADSEYPGMEL
jgi:hypothetical protein